MGNEQSTVKNVDKRTARREQAQYFVPAIRAFKMDHTDGKPVDVVTTKLDGQVAEQAAGGGMRVCVRKRPIFPHELSQGEYDVVTCTLKGGAAQVVVHDARLHSDMVHMFINHHAFTFDAVFGEAASNRHVYLETAAPLVRRAVNDGVTATIMMYGQTGSGKTFTMSAIYESASLDLFEAIAAAPGPAPTVSVSFVELAGDKCADMLNRGKQAEVTVHNAQELLCFIRLACALRATEATGVHDQSSRSHAVCRIFINREGSQEGILQLIDLAGSEHRIDSAEHDAARRKEGAQINSSLAALKECVRCKATPKVGGNAPFLPYRKSKLTHLLRACFEEGNPTVVIATVSPSSKDTEHSLNTIRHACIMDGQGSGSLEPKPSVAGRNGMPETIKMASHIKCVTTASHVIGGEVTKQNIGEIDITKLARERRAQRIAEKADGSGGDGQGKWNDAPPKKPEDATTPAESDRRRTQSMAAAERKALRALEPERIKQLEQARAKVGDDKRQSQRLQRWGAVFAAQMADEQEEKAYSVSPESPGGSKWWGGAGGDGQGLGEGRRASAEGDSEGCKPGSERKSTHTYSSTARARRRVSSAGSEGMKMIIDSDGLGVDAPAPCIQTVGGWQDNAPVPKPTNGGGGSSRGGRIGHQRVASAGRRKTAEGADGVGARGQRENDMDMKRENVEEIGGLESAREKWDWAVVDRAAEVAKRREEAERQKKMALQQKLEEKEKKRVRGPLAVLTMHKNALSLDGDAADDYGGRGGGRGCASSEVGVLEAEEARLEREMDKISREMQATDVSEAKKFAHKKILAVCRAEWLKIQRKSKAARAEQQAQAQVVAEQHQREVERKRFQAEAEMVPPPAMKPSAYYNSRLPPKSHRHTDVETGKIMERGTERGFDGRLEDGAAADLDDWLVSLRAESAALPQPAQPKAGRRGGSRRGREELLGPGPSVVESDGTWSPPPSPPRRQRGMKSRPVDASAEGEGAKSAAAKVPGPRKAVTGVSKAAHAIVFSSPPLQPPAGRGGRCNEESMGKGLSNDIVAMLEEDARAFHDVLLARVLRTCLTNWRDQAEIGVMSCRSR